MRCIRNYFVSKFSGFRNSFEYIYIYIIFLTRIIRLIYYNMINLNWMNKIISIFPEDTRKLVSN